MIKIKMMLAAAGTIAAFGIAAPAAAETPDVRLAMASYASTTAGVDAEARAASKERHYKDHHARNGDPHASGTCEECAACTKCEECMACKRVCNGDACQIEVESGTNTA